jgi:hypothetical protein
LTAKVHQFQKKNLEYLGKHVPFCATEPMLQIATWTGFKTQYEAITADLPVNCGSDCSKVKSHASFG